MRRQPALALAEVTWRWCFAAAAVLLAAVSLLEYLNSVPVSWRERMLAESGEPLLVLAALAHALRGSAIRLVAGVIVAGTAATVLWMLCAAVGRLTTLKALLPEARGGGFRSLFGLNFLRAALALAAVLAALGALILGGFAGPAKDSAPSLVLAAVLIGCIGLVWALLNWLLSLAAISVVRDRLDSFGAIGAAVNLVRSRFGEVVLTSLPFVLLHCLALGAALASGVLIFDLMTRFSPAAGWALLAIAAAYFAYADFLYITRLAAYVALAGAGAEQLAVPEQVPPPEPTLPVSEAGALGLKPETV